MIDVYGADPHQSHWWANKFSAFLGSFSLTGVQTGVVKQDWLKWPSCRRNPLFVRPQLIPAAALLLLGSWAQHMCFVSSQCFNESGLPLDSG